MKLLNLLLLVLPCLLLAQAPPYALRSVAGRLPGADGIPATSAFLESPSVIAVNPRGGYFIGGAAGYLYSVDAQGTIRLITNQQRLVSIVADSSGNLYGVDGLSKVVKIDPDGNITDFAGSSTRGFSGDGGPATDATFFQPAGIALDNKGNIYVSDTFNHRIRRITPDGVIRTIAGNGQQRSSGDSGPASSAGLNYPSALAIDSDGAIYVAEMVSPRVRKISADGVITTIAGNGVNTYAVPGIATASPLRGNVSLASGTFGRLYLCEGLGYSVWRLESGSLFRLTSGNAGFGGDEGPAAAAAINLPTGIAVDSDGRILFVDSLNSRVRRITPNGEISTVAGVGRFGGDGGPATDALLQFPYQLASDGKGGFLFVDFNNYRIRSVNANGIITTVAGTGVNQGTVNETTQARNAIISPRGLATAPDGTIYFGHGSRLRRVRPDGVIDTVAGTGVNGDTGDGGPARSATLRVVSDVARDTSGNVYVVDNQSHRVRKINPSGAISTVAGTGVSGYNGDGILATTAQLTLPDSIAIDKQGNLYIGETARVRRVTPAGVISTVAGNGQFGLGADDFPANSALSGIRAIAIDDEGRLIISANASIFMVTGGRSYRLTGSGAPGFAGDGLSAKLGQVALPEGLLPLPGGDILFSDTSNHRIRRLVLNLPEQLEITGGAAQTGPVSSTLPELLRVRVNGKAKAPVNSVVVRFSIETGAATLSATSVTTDASGLAGIQVTLGREPGEVVVRAESAGLAPVRFTLTATAETTGGPTTQPRITDVVSAGPNRILALSPKALMLVRGAGFAAPGTERRVNESELPDSLDGVCVEAGGQRGLIKALTPESIEWLAPDIAVGASVQVEVILDCAGDAPTRSNPFTVPVQSATPEFLAAEDSTSAKYLIRAAAAESGQPAATVKSGQRITLYALGLGISPEIALRIGETELPAAAILALTPIAEQPGIWQIECKLPDSLPEGEIPVTLRVSAIDSPTGAFLVIAQ